MTTSVAVQSKEGVQCFTDGCTGQVKLAQELEVEAGIDTHRRELLRLSEQAKKAERPQQQQDQPEQRRGRKKGAGQRVPEIPGNTLAWVTLPAEWAQSHTHTPFHMHVASHNSSRSSPSTGVGARALSQDSLNYQVLSLIF